MTGTSFLLAPGSGPQDYATRRAMIQAMMPQFGKASTIGEGLGQLFTGIGLGRQQKALDAEEAAARQSAMTGFDSLMSRGGTAQPGGMSINGPIPFTPPAPVERPDPNSPQGIGLDAMAALGHVSPYGHGIASVESAGSGGYSAIGPDTGKGRAYGKYQVMDFNIPDWTLKHTGVRMTPEEFLASPGAQEAVFNGEFGSYVQKYGNPQDAASVWFSGRPMAGNNSSDGYTTVPEYVQKFNAGMQSAPSTAELAAAASNPMLTEGQRAMAAQMLAEAQKQQDPAYQMGLQADQLAIQKAQLELAQMQNPKPGFVQLSPQEVTALGLPPGVYQRGPDGRIDTVEKTQGMPDPIAGIKARAAAAGLTEGTAEYQTFMLNGGKPQDGMVIESDGQGGFRMVQGAAASGATAKPFTEAQSKDVVYATRAKGALSALDPLADKLADRSDIAAGWLPFGLGGGMQDPDYQVAKTAGDEFLQAILRKDTGAAITPVEQDLYGETYLPRPGDSAERLTYKSQARQRAVAAIEAGMSPAQIIAQERAIQASNPDIPPAPSGVDPADWQYMTPEERALFQ